MYECGLRKVQKWTHFLMNLELFHRVGKACAPAGLHEELRRHVGAAAHHHALHVASVVVVPASTASYPAAKAGEQQNKDALDVFSYVLIDPLDTSKCLSTFRLERFLLPSGALDLSLLFALC